MIYNKYDNSEKLNLIVFSNLGISQYSSDSKINSLPMNCRLISEETFRSEIKKGSSLENILDIYKNHEIPFTKGCGMQTRDLKLLEWWLNGR